MKGKVKMEIFYNGAEVNPLISAADLLLRLIDTHQFGNLSHMTVIKPVLDHASVLASKVRYSEIVSTDDLRSITPTLGSDMDEGDFVHHPVLYLVWNPKESRKLVKTSFEWGQVYNLAIATAAKAHGCVKNLELGTDELRWNIDKDFLVPCTSADLDLIAQLKEIHSEVPKTLTVEEMKKGLGQE
jgi:hypothetical protein